MPKLAGLHHVRLPVRDVPASRDWYSEVLGFETLFEEEIEDAVVGAAVVHEAGVVLGLHLDPDRARALAGFAFMALTVAEPDGLGGWSQWLERMEVDHGPVVRTQLGTYLEVPDPDGLVVRLHSSEQPSLDEA